MSFTVSGRLGEDLCREVRSRACDETVAIAHRVEATTIAAVLVDEL
jgi:hypothetical protein